MALPTEWSDELIRLCANSDAIGILMRKSYFDQMPVQKSSTGNTFMMSGVPVAVGPDIMFEEHQRYRIMKIAYFDRIVELLA